MTEKADGLTEAIELAIATMPVKNRSEAEAVGWLLVNTPIAAYVAAAVRRYPPA